MAIVKPIVYGNLSSQLPKVQPGGRTHTWTLYVKCATGEDLSPILQNVTFRLHESFSNAIRVVEKPPYEISESGWGEFEVAITLNFVDPEEKPVTLIHFLKLHPNAETLQPSKKSLVSERYDELVFEAPSATMQAALAKVIPASNKRHAARDYDAEEERQLEVMQAARTKLRALLREFKTKFKELEEEIKVLKAEGVQTALPVGETPA
eukprot:m.41618 g.41618  ORF g.41618 m.41618 type:complete len:208 (+) comp10528_c0_seq1:28-651(+)